MTREGLVRLPGTVTIVESPEAVAVAAADWVAERSARAMTMRGEFSIALAGGSTPRRLYQALAAPERRHAVTWEGWRVYFGDERACPPGDPSSNFRMATETLLGLVPVPERHVHRMEAEREDLDDAAADYSAELAATLRPGPDGAPRLDCVLLGLGENGHTASLFPGTPALQVRDAWAARGLADYEPHDRITLTFPTINAASQVAFLVTGAGKGEALRGVGRGTVPAAGVRPLDGELRWFLDAAAADSLAG